MKSVTGDHSCFREDVYMFLFIHRLGCVYIYIYCPNKDPTFKRFGNPGEDYLKGNPKSLNFYFLVIWWSKYIYIFIHIDYTSCLWVLLIW